MLRLLGGALFPGLFFLKAFKLPAAFFGLPFFAALGTGALPRFLGICCGRLRIRFTLVGPDGRALRLRLLLRMDRRKANSGSSCSAGVLFSCASSSGRLVGSIVCSMFCESTILAL